jgi:hypothetical protein
VSDEAMQEFIANCKEALMSSREIAFSQIADFTFAQGGERIERAK